MIDKVTCPCCKGLLELTNKKNKLKKEFKKEKQQFKCSFFLSGNGKIIEVSDFSEDDPNYYGQVV